MSKRSWPILLILGVVVLWCSIHAVGSWRHDPRRAVVLAACAAFFVGFWLTALLVRRILSARKAAATGSGWNIACVVGFVLASLSTMFAVPCLIGTLNLRHVWFRTASLTAFGLLSAAILFAIIGLSNPSVRRGKGWGLSAFAMAAVLVLATLIRLAMAISSFSEQDVSIVVHGRG